MVLNKNPIHHKSPLHLAIDALTSGGIIAYPTEAVFGLGCDPQNETAIKKLLEIKKRKKEKGLILIAANIDQLAPYIQELDADTERRVLPTWPGPTTWLLPAKSNVSEFLRGKHKTIAVRVTNHPLAKQLCKSWGNALVSTSANITSEPAAHSAENVKIIFANNVDYCLEGNVGDLARPSQIRDGHTGKIIRH
ncbi:MAG: threonylcarbamoyl-AMP synthase [Gammaproteobacteria bacterium]|nr:threonylcarbamoyl-AMP synthase [Gammaproteobacteria bacterium]